MTNSTTFTATTTAAAAQQSTAGDAPRYYNLTTYGSGYVSKIRDVTGTRKGVRPAVYCRISVPTGPKDNTKWLNFDVHVVGVETIAFINALRKDVAAGKKPHVEFSIGDIYGHVFNHKDSDERGCMIKGRLIKASRANAALPLSTIGFGFLNNLKPAGNGFDCEIVGLHGAVEQPNRTHFKVSASKDPQLLSTLDIIDQAEDVKSVLVSFRLAMTEAEGFVFGPSSAKAGQDGTNIYGELSSISSLKINGEKVVLAKPEATKVTEAACEAVEELAEEAVA